MDNNISKINVNGIIHNIKDIDARKSMIGCTDTNNGVSGQVPAPKTGDNKSFLRGDGTWQVPIDTTYNIATEEQAGLVSPEMMHDFDVAVEKIDILATAHRGYSFINIKTSPTNNIMIGTNRYYKSIEQTKIESNRDDIVPGDILIYSGNLYAILGILEGNINYDLYYYGSIIGPQGIQGIQGIQGPQGPKGDPGDGYFILRDEDYEIIADMVEEKSYHSYERSDSSEPIRPNIFYRFGLQYELNITFATPSSEYRSNEYMFEFISPNDRPTTLIMPSNVRWCYDPIIETGKKYQVSVLNDLGVICGA